jgi:hypothetical protein
MALPIVLGLGAVGTGLAAIIPWITSSMTSDASSSLFAQATSRIGQTIGTTIGRVKNEEELMIQEVNSKYIEIENYLRKVVYSEEMVKEYIPDALIESFDGKISSVDDIYKRIDEFKQDERLKQIIFEKYNGFLKYREPYLRIVTNFYSLFDRIIKLKDEINRIYDDQASKVNIQNRYQETDPEIQKITGQEFPKFIRSEISILYEDFMNAYSDYNQYINRMGNFYKLIQQGGYDKLDMYKVAVTDISKLTGRKEGPLLRTTDQVVNVAEPILDKISKYRLTYLICLKNIASTIDTWQTKFKSNKQPIISSIRGILESEKKQIEILIGDHTTNISDLDGIRQELQNYKKNNKLDDARQKYEIIKTKDKKLDDLKEQILLFHSRMLSYADTIRQSGEDTTIQFIPCNMDQQTSITPITPTSISSVPPSGSSNTSAKRQPLADPIIMELNKVNFTGATDKDLADDAIEDFNTIINTQLPNKIKKIKNEYINTMNLKTMLETNKEFFGKADIYGSIDTQNFKIISDLLK